MFSRLEVDVSLSMNRPQGAPTENRQVTTWNDTIRSDVANLKFVSIVSVDVEQIFCNINAYYLTTAAT